MNSCTVAGCGGAAWTTWLDYDLCKKCSEAASVWSIAATTSDDAFEVLTKIAESLQTSGTRSGPEEPNR